MEKEEMDYRFIYLILVNLSLPIVPDSDRRPMLLDDTSLRRYGFDALAQLRLIAAMEHHFGITVCHAELQMMNTPLKVVAIVERKLAAERGE
ncbi:acyl carrier protein [Amycolatopsis sp. NPDC049868]|uniref:acyl carrier protein n=1 Tax=Amycolatopsis sp. NPDC049868 TaxID=3363934 RepID=UPI0037966A72